MKFENFITFFLQITIIMMYINLIYTRATSYLNCFNVFIFVPYAFILVTVK